MAENTDATEELTEMNATVFVDDVIFALKMNGTNGADDRVIAIPQYDGAEANVRRAFRGSERYDNPESAPVRIRPESLVEDAWTRAPRRHQVDCVAIGVPKLSEERTDEQEQEIDEAHDELVDVWETDVRRMIGRDHRFESKGNKITLTGEE